MSIDHSGDDSKQGEGIENETTILETGAVETNESSIKVIFEGDSISGQKVRIKVIDPLSRVYDVDQPAPSIEIPLFLQSDDSNSKSELRIIWTDYDGDLEISGGDELKLYNASGADLYSGEWYLKIVTKLGEETVYLSDAIDIT
ncbi:MAG: hypothetical protein ACOC80_07760 [Petrotogales bacterium]